MIQGTVEDRVVLQVDQAEPEDQDVPRQLKECGTHTDLGRPLRVPGTGVSGVSIKDRCVNAAHLTIITTESIRVARPRNLIQPAENTSFATTGASLGTMGQQCFDLYYYALL